MLFQTAISFGKVNQKDIDDLVEKIMGITGIRVEVERQYLISTDDADISAAFDSLASAMPQRQLQLPEPLIMKAKKKYKKSKDKEINQSGKKNEPTRGPHVRSIKVISTNEMISRYELNKRLKERTIAIGTPVHSPKSGTLVVTADTEGSDLVLA